MKEYYLHNLIDSSKLNKEGGEILIFSKKDISNSTHKREGLLEVRKLGKAAAIIFVHGLQGDPYRTWTKKGCSPLPHLFVEDETYDHFDVFTFGYNTGFILKRHHFREISNLLYTEVNAKLGDYKSLYFITHSMGGIVVQSMLAEQVEHRNKDFLEAVRGIVYLAVPFLGSTIASAASIPYMIIPPIIGEIAVSVQVRSLQVFSKDLAEMSEKWVRYRVDELRHLEELNLYGQSDKSVAVPSARAPYIKNSFAVAEGHISICKMDKESTVYQMIANFHREIGQLASINTVNDAETEVSKYLQWLKLRTGEFIVPGVNVPLSIEHAWASLHVIDEPSDAVSDSLEKEIAKYHEWERLSHRHQKKNAQEVTELGQRVILIGGPGSGKSTLAMRAVYRLTVKGEKVLYVRLPYVAKEMEQGKSFEDALWSVALDGYAGDKKLLKTEIGHINILIADGLDECEPNRRRVSQSLYEWSIGRQDTRVVVTTRPVGYESAQFNSFHHVEILPLDEKEINVYSLKLLQTLNDDEKKVAEMHASFKQQIEKSKMANVAARSPLLLNFLIQLLVSGKSFGKYRVELYSKIIEEWLGQSDRIKEKRLNDQIAIRSIEWIGWILQNVLNGKGGRSRQEMLQKLSAFIEDELDVRSLQAKEIATDCLQFWLDLGVLEHLKVGKENGYTFIHLTLGEYAAGKYISSLPEERQREHLLEKMHIPIWRETILLAGGAGCVRLFVKTILENTNGKHDLYNDIAFAAAILAEAEPISDLNKKVAENAVNTISSPFSLLCYEAGEVLEGIAQQEPDWTFSLVEPLLQHDQDWTKLVAYKLGFMSRRLIINPAIVFSLIELKPKESFNLQDFKIPSGWMVWNKVIELSMEQLLNTETLDGKELVKVVEALAEVGFSTSFHRKFTRMLQDMGRFDLLKILERKLKSSLDKINFHKGSLKILEGERALLTAVLRQITDKQEWSFDDMGPLVEVGKLYHAMQLGEKPIFDLDPLAEGVKLSVVDEVIKGMLLVHELVEGNIYNEIQWVLSDKENERMLLSRLPDVLEHDPNWERAESLLNKDLLIQSLSYPSHTIASNGSLLLVNCFENEEMMAQFNAAFMEAEGEGLFYYTIVAGYILEENALNAILERLKGKRTKGLRYLYGSLPNYSQAKNNELVSTALMNGINDKEPIVVKSVAEAMLKIGGTYDEEEIFKIATFWDENGVLCDSHQIMVVGSFCPECHVVPNSPLPELITLLKKSELLSFENRKYFSKHPRSDVQKAGFETLVYFLSTNLKEIRKLVQEIKHGREPSVLLEAVFSIGHFILKPISEELLSLIESNSFDVKTRLLKELANSQWVDQSDAIPIIKKALDDENSSVRNQAVIIYRSLRL